MADLAPTAMKAYSDGATPALLQLGEAGVIADVVYKKSSDSKYWLADANDSAMADAKYVLVSAGDADGYAYGVSAGSYNPGVTVVVGTQYVLSSAAGKIAPYADLGTGEYYTKIGVGATATKLTINIEATGLLTP